nr:hypothetical protein [Tanacetum cinerariifolium]
QLPDQPGGARDWQRDLSPLTPRPVGNRRNHVLEQSSGLVGRHVHWNTAFSTA